MNFLFEDIVGCNRRRLRLRSANDDRRNLIAVTSRRTLLSEWLRWHRSRTLRCGIGVTNARFVLQERADLKRMVKGFDQQLLTIKADFLESGMAFGFKAGS